MVSSFSSAGRFIRMSDLGEVAITCWNGKTWITYTMRRFDMMEDLMALHRVCCHQAWPEQSVRIRRCIHKGRGGSPSPCSTLISFQVAVALICGRSRTQLLQSRTINEVSTLYYASKSIKGWIHLEFLQINTIEVCDGIGDGHSSADAFATSWHVLPKQQLGVLLLHQLHLWI